MKCPTEIAISDRREAELAKNGFMPLIHRKNSDFAAFIGAQSLQKPTEYDDADATANANLAARLPYLFACRFAHYLKCIVRDKVGSFKSARTWSAGSTSGSCSTSTVIRELHRADQGREAAGRGRGRGRGSRGQPGYYQSKFFLKPHYQLTKAEKSDERRKAPNVFAAEMLHQIVTQDDKKAPRSNTQRAASL
jgi:type VI secretion system protein ImpC